MKQYFVCTVWLLPLCFAAGCGQGAPKDTGAAEDVPTSVMEIPAEAHTLDIGDVEADLRLEATVAESAVAAGVRADEMRTKMSELTSVTATVPPPAPSSIPIKFVLTSRLDYSANPILVNVRVLRDGIVIENARTQIAGFLSDAPFEVTVDALKDLTSIPESMLIHAEMDMQMIDDTQAAVSESSTELSNPVRINFTGGGAPAQTPPAAAPIPVEPAAP